MSLPLRLHENDDVLIATEKCSADILLQNAPFCVLAPIPAGHKIAARALKKGEAVRRYNQIIGFATADIPAGAHVHTHNLGMGEFARDYGIATNVHPIRKAQTAATFLGFRRKNGTVGTRNYLAIIPSVNCSSTVASAIARYFSEDKLKAYRNIDGVLALTHALGCGMNLVGEGMDILRRSLTGYATHPNFAGVLFVGLGCEQNQIEPMLAMMDGYEEGMVQSLVMQKEGGTRAAIEKGIALVSQMLRCANDYTRTQASASHLIVGLNCGGSDGYSGITANPALGGASDLLIAQGGTTVLSETPEIYGAEHLLTRRAISHDVAHKLIDRIRWWQDYTQKTGGQMDNNPSVGNKAGGLTTILEKSLGAVAKSGTSPLTAVYLYAEKISEKGFVYMDTPGYDPVSATGQAAGGAQIICFTTGRGSAFGCAGVPTLKLATNNAIFERMGEDMDENCGDILTGTPIKEVSERIFHAILRHASGEKVKSELLGYGQNEFLPWHVGAVM